MCEIFDLRIFYFDKYDTRKDILGFWYYAHQQLSYLKSPELINK